MTTVRFVLIGLLPFSIINRYPPLHFLHVASLSQTVTSCSLFWHRHNCLLNFWPPTPLHTVYAQFDEVSFFLKSVSHHSQSCPCYPASAERCRIIASYSRFAAYVIPRKFENQLHSITPAKCNTVGAQLALRNSCFNGDYLYVAIADLTCLLLLLLLTNIMKMS